MTTPAPMPDESQGAAPCWSAGVHVLARCVSAEKNAVPEDNAEGRLAMFRHTLMAWGTRPKHMTEAPRQSVPNQAPAIDTVTLMWRPDDVREPVEIAGPEGCFVREGNDVHGEEDLLTTLVSEDPRPVRLHGRLRDSGDPSTLEIELPNGAVFRTSSDILKGGTTRANVFSEPVAAIGSSTERSDDETIALDQDTPERAFPTTVDEDARVIASPEAFAITALMSDYPKRRHMRTDPHTLRVEHRRPKAAAHTYLDLSEIVPYDVDETEADTSVRLMDGVSRHSVSRDEALSVLYAVARLLDSPEGKADVGFTELLDLEGKTRLGRDERAARALELHRAFVAANAWKVCVRRPWKSGGKTTLIEHDAPMFHYEGPAYRAGQKPLPGMGWTTPHGFVFRDSTLSAQMRKEPKQASPFGPLIQLARIPRGQACGDWAVSIGMALGIFVGRVNAGDVGATVRHTRRLLLTTFTPDRDPEAILRGNDPQRAREYWAKAMGALREQGMVVGYDDPAQNRGKGWKDSWLDEVVTIRLAGEWARVAERIQSAKADNVLKLRTRDKGPKSARSSSR